MSAQNLLEVTVYTLVLNGRFLRYRDQFEDAIDQLSVARSLLDELAGAAMTSRDQALATVFSDDIGPEIRYCAHELGRTKAYDVDGIVAELAKKHKNTLVEGCDALVAKFKSEVSPGVSKGQLEPLMWEGEPVPVRSPELVDVLLKVQEAKKKLEVVESKAGRSDKGATAYDAILLALSDAEEVSRKLAEAQQVNFLSLLHNSYSYLCIQSQSSSSAAAIGGRDIHFVHAYVVYQLLSHRIKRDLVLVAALVSHQNPKTAQGQSDDLEPRIYPAIIKLFDTVLQSLNQMRTLSIIDDSADLSPAVESRISFSKAQRCGFLFGPLFRLADYPFFRQMFLSRQIIRGRQEIRRSAHTPPARFHSRPGNELIPPRIVCLSIVLPAYVRGNKTHGERRLLGQP
jgi:signal recognition particle subunit SRP68